MSTPKTPERCALLIAPMVQPDVDREQIEALLEERYGKIGIASKSFAFTFSDYYEPEMGADLMKWFLVFEDFIAPDDLVRIKHETYDIESQFTENQQRTVNLDPGLFDHHRLILSTGKPAPHRIYLGSGVYGDLHLMYIAGVYTGFRWTYVDYLAPENQAFFNEARAYFLKRKRLVQAASTKETIS